MLTGCLALVRPVGMGDSEVEDWLGAAVQAVGPRRLSVLNAACAHAKRTCTHHAQVVPAIVAECERIEARETSIADFTLPALPAPPQPQLSAEDFERIIAERGRALSVALDRGLIVSNGDGTFRLPDRAA